MSARRPRTDAGTGLTFVGAPFDLFRVAQSVPLDQAELNFDAYVTTTLAYSAMYGGRFNRIGEFGALYTTLDEDTAWIEVAGRYEREGVDALPRDMGVIRVLVSAGQYADVRDDDGCDAWEVDPDELTEDPQSDAGKETCWDLARTVRAVGDAIMTLSARNGESNMPLFPDRNDSGVRLTLVSVERRGPPEQLLQRARESW